MTLQHAHMESRQRPLGRAATLTTRTALLAATVLLPGCAGLGYAMQYSGSELTQFEWAGRPWRIFDKAAEQRMMITPSLGRSAGQGLIEGLTFGIADTEIPKPDYQAAVEGFLAGTGRANCQVTDGYKLIEPQWEFTYRC